MRARWRVVTAGLWCLGLVLGGSHRADAQEDRSSAAEALFQDGRVWLRAGDYALACAKFGESLALEPAVGTLISLAECEEAQHHLVSARQHWQDAADLADAKNDPLGRGPFARGRFQDVDRRVPRIVVHLPPGARVERSLQVDGIPVSTPATDSGMPLEPGPHDVRVSADGRPIATFRVDLREGERRILEVEDHQSTELAAAGARAGAGTEPRSGAGDAPVVPAWQGPTGWAVGSAGLAAIAVGIPLYVAARTAFDRSMTPIERTNCVLGRCVTTTAGFQEDVAQERQATNLGQAALWSLAGGVFALTVGGTLEVATAWARKEHPTAQSTVRVVPDWQRPVAYIATAVGVVALSAAAALAISDQFGSGGCSSDSSGPVPATSSSTCAASYGDPSSASARGQAAAITLLGGATALTVGGTLWLASLWARRPDAPPPISLAPAVDVHGVVFHLRGSF